jgi:hypothetical protein
MVSKIMVYHLIVIIFQSHFHQLMVYHGIYQNCHYFPSKSWYIIYHGIKNHGFRHIFLVNIPFPPLRVSTSPQSAADLFARAEVTNSSTLDP